MTNILASNMYGRSTFIKLTLKSNAYNQLNELGQEYFSSPLIRRLHSLLYRLRVRTQVRQYRLNKQSRVKRQGYQHVVQDLWYVEKVSFSWLADVNVR